MAVDDGGADKIGTIPAYLETPPSWTGPPPVETKPQELPFGGLRWEDFERLCLQLVHREASVEFCRPYGTAGQKQGGIDFYGRRRGAKKYRVYQCKRVVGFGPAKIREAVTAFLDGDWVAKTEVFVLCTKENLASAERVQELEKQRSRLAKKGIALETFDSHGLSLKLKDLPHVVGDFFGPAWASAFCGPGPARSRQDYIDDTARASRARCVERWVAAGVPKPVASEFADDASVGVPLSGISLPGGGRVVVITGDVGAGKSLLAERLLQAAIGRFSKQSNAPIPVFLRAHSIVGSFETAVRDAVGEVGDPRAHGVFVIVDGAEERGLSWTNDLISSARVLANTWSETTIVASCRVLPQVATDDERLQIPLLSEADALVLISRVLGEKVTAADAFGWPGSVREAILRPLYAILLASHLRDRTPNMDWSISDLLTSLARRSLGRVSVGESVAARAAERLAMLATDRGGPVPTPEVGEETDVRALVDSGMVVERRGAVSFALPILTQWFAARSLQRGNPKPEELLETPLRLEAWRYALIIAVGSFSHDHVARILKPIVAGCPSFASILITEGLGGWSLDDEVPPPRANESGERIREAMLAWIQALGSLAKLIAPLRQDGSLRSLGVCVAGAFLTTAWYVGAKDLPPVVEISVDDLYGPDTGHEWPHMSARPGRRSAWAWRWTLRELSNRLRPLVDGEALPSSHDVFRREAAWALALTLVGQGSLNHTPIPLDLVEVALARVPLQQVYRFKRDRFRLESLKSEIARIRTDGGTHLSPLWPGPDLDTNAGSWVWDAFSAERIRLRGEVVYQAAVRAYKALVEEWFSGFAARLDTYALLPARIVGEVLPPARNGKAGLQPVVRWYFEPLPRGQNCDATFRLVENQQSMSRTDLEALFAKIRASRPEAGPWVWISYSNSVLDVFGPTPATELSYGWLRKDLRHAHWLG